MKKYYVEVQDFHTDYRNDIIIYDDLNNAISSYEKELHDMCNYNYFHTQKFTVCIGELIFKDEEDFNNNENYDMNELSCCDVEEYYHMTIDERLEIFNRLKIVKGNDIYI